MSVPQIILASSSPRRESILRDIGIRFIKCPADIDESVLDKKNALKLNHALQKLNDRLQKYYKCTNMYKNVQNVQVRILRCTSFHSLSGNLS